MGKSYVRIIQAVALAAAILGLLLSTPSLEARTRPKHKKTKIVFDSNEPAPDQGELGDEVVQPKLTHHGLSDPRQVVHLRGSSVDDIYAKNKVSKKAKQIQHRAGPDLIAGPNDGDVEQRAHAAGRTTIGDSLAVDESALGSFKPSSSKHTSLAKHSPSTKHSPKTKIVAASSRPDVIEDSLAGLDESRTARQAAPTMHPRESTRVASNPIPVAKPAPAAKSTFVTASAPKHEDALDFDSTPQVQPAKRQQLAPRVAKVATTSTASRTSIAPPQQAQLEEPQRPRSRIYMRDVQPVLHQQANVRNMNEPSEFNFNFAFENTTSAGRKYELETPGGRNYMMKNELFLGTHHISGWGAKLSIDYIATSNDDSTKDVHEMGDPSIIIEHPTLFQTVDVSVKGFGRYYMPVAANSKAVGLQHFAYYLIADLKLAEGFDLNNTFIPRYYVQNQYADADAFSLLYDHTELGKHVADWLRVGFGQRTQIESHQATQPGTSVEVYPFAEILAISNTTIQTRIYVPLVAHGTVNGAPGSPAGPVESGISNMQAELFARIAF